MAATTLRRSDELELYRVAMFRAHGLHLLQRYLNPWAEAVLRQWQPPPATEATPLAVLVDDRPDLLLRFCVLNTLLMGRMQLRLRLVTAPASAEAMRQLCSGLEPWVEVVVQPVAEGERFSWHSYNSLLKSAAFWQHLPAEHLLIVQVDTLLVEPLDFSLFAFDYVGSPWAKGKLLSHDFPRYSPDLQQQWPPSWEGKILCQTVPDGLVNGNGGLSIRSRTRMAAICASEASEADEPEDIYFARCLQRHGAHVPALEQVQRFACETHHQESIGAHASWRYLAAAEQAQMYERHLKHLLALLAASAAAAGKA